MKKTICLMILLCTILSGFSTMASGETDYANPLGKSDDYGRWVLRSPADVYANYDLQSSILSRAGAGTIYAIIDSTERNHWIKIKYIDQQTAELKEGWIKEDLLDSPSYLYSGGEQSYEHQGESRYANGSGNQNTNQTPAGENIGFVLCESLSIRERAEFQAPIVATMMYQSTFTILSESDSWYRIRYVGMERTVEGWIRSEYVIKNPQYYTASGETPAYSHNASNAKRVGLIDAGTQLVIIADIDGYYIVSLRGASAFIKK